MYVQGMSTKDHTHTKVVSPFGMLHVLFVAKHGRVFAVLPACRQASLFLGSAKRGEREVEHIIEMNSLTFTLMSETDVQCHYGHYYEMNALCNLHKPFIWTAQRNVFNIHK